MAASTAPVIPCNGSGGMTSTLMLITELGYNFVVTILPYVADRLALQMTAHRRLPKVYCFNSSISSCRNLSAASSVPNLALSASPCSRSHSRSLARLSISASSICLLSLSAS
jgi:hypothetical protein